MDDEVEDDASPAHGTPVASILVGAHHNVLPDHPLLTVGGVAHLAHIISYKVCQEGNCPISGSAAAVQQAIIDGVDVLNYSISGGSDPWTDPVDLAFLDAFEAGIVVSVAAGNDGPGPGSAASSAPWTISVANATHGGVVANTLVVTEPADSSLDDVPAVPAAGLAPDSDLVNVELVSAREVDGNAFGCASFDDDDLFDGAIVLIERGGGCSFTTKFLNAEDAGAIGVVVYNDDARPPFVASHAGLLPQPQIPAVMVSADVGAALEALLADEVEISISSAMTTYHDPAWQDILNRFSSRGPIPFDLLAPTITAPGTSILGAVGPGPGSYDVYTGTSFAAPHVGGAAALLRNTNVFPDLSPAEIQSALVSTAVPEVRREDGLTPANWFEQGSGRLDIHAASRVGLVMHEEAENFAKANPADDGGDPRTLNLPSFVDGNCRVVCEFTRTVTNATDVTATWTLTSGGLGTVMPSSIELDPGESQPFTLRIPLDQLDPDGWTFGRVEVTTGEDWFHGAAIADQHFPIAVMPHAPEAEIGPDAVHVGLVQGATANRQVQITNAGGRPLEWEIGLDGDGLAGHAGPPADPGVPDGGFEAGDTDGPWDDYSQHYDPWGVICSQATCGSHLARTGSWWVWFGGILNSETAWVRQHITIAEDARYLQFFLQIFEGNSTARMRVTIGEDEDEEVVFDVTHEDAASYYAYTEVLVDVRDYADGGEHLLAFHYEHSGGDTNTSFMLDDVALLANGTCATPIAGGWLTATPAAGTAQPGQTGTVTVSVDATSLDPGSYGAALCVGTNDPDRELAVIPVTVTVVAPSGGSGGPGAPAEPGDPDEPDDPDDPDEPDVPDDPGPVDVPDGPDDPESLLPAGVGRMFGLDRLQTAIAVSQATFDDGEAGSVVLARADEFADALAGTPLAVDRDAPVLLTVSSQLVAAVTEEIQRVLAPGGTVYLLGGTAALDASVEADLGALGYDVVRLWGPERIATALAIADELGDRDHVLLTTGEDFPDALAAGAAAAAIGGVVVLTPAGASHPLVDDYLAARSGAAVTAIGGPAAQAYPSVTPIVGASRAETAVLVAEAFFDGHQVVGLARQDDFPDALAGGAHIGRHGGPLLLTASDSVHPAVEGHLCANTGTVTTVIAYGGPAALDDSVLQAVEARLDGTGCDTVTATPRSPFQPHVV